MSKSSWLVFGAILGLCGWGVSCGKIKLIDDQPQKTSNAASGPIIDGLPASQHRIFVSSSVYDGNFGGLTSGDSYCQALAKTAGLTRTYKAILSAEGVAAFAHIKTTGEIYIFKNKTDKTLIAKAGENQLWTVSGTTVLQSGLTLDENYNTLPVRCVWTGSDTVGAAQTGSTCTSWASNSGTATGQIGYVAQTSVTFLSHGPSPCSNTCHLYCISQ